MAGAREEDAKLFEPWTVEALCGLPSFPDTDKTHTPHLLTEHERDQAEDGAEAEAQEPPGPPAGMERKKDIIKLGRSILSGCLEGRRVFNVHYSLGEPRRTLSIPTKHL